MGGLYRQVPFNFDQAGAEESQGYFRFDLNIDRILVKGKVSDIDGVFNECDNFNFDVKLSGAKLRTILKPCIDNRLEDPRNAMWFSILRSDLVGGSANFSHDSRCFRNLNWVVKYLTLGIVDILKKAKSSFDVRSLIYKL